jgi:hypothetical protein
MNKILAALAALALLASPAGAYPVTASRVVQVSALTDFGGVATSKPIFGFVVQVGSDTGTDESTLTCQVSARPVVPDGIRGGTLILVQLPPTENEIEIHGLMTALPEELPPQVKVRRVLMPNMPELAIPRWHIRLDRGECRVTLVIDRLPELKLPAP